MTKKVFITLYGIYSLAILALAAFNYFGGEKNLWWFACMLSGAISLTYCYFWLRNKISEEGFVNFIVSIFLITSFLISFGLSVYQSGDENLPIILAGINAVSWIIYALGLSKLLK